MLGCGLSIPEVAIRVHGAGGGPPPPSDWILATGFWDDSGVWEDTAVWID
jgi:hypothetical protein